MARCWFLSILAFWLLVAGPASAQPPAATQASPEDERGAEQRSPDSGPPSAPPKTQQLDFGMVLRAEGGGFRNVVGTITVPADWPDQQRVRVVKEDVPQGASVKYRKIADVGQQMAVRFPALAPGREVRAVVTFEVEGLSPPPVPRDTQRFATPDRAKLPARIADHLAASPKIESDRPDVRKAAEEAIGEREGAWEKVKAIHEWVYKNIEFAGGEENVQTCMKTLRDRRGVCAEKNSLAVAMLRATGFPARLVRVPRHCYYEVYLLDGEGEGWWISADAATRPSIRPEMFPGGGILQKGDSMTIIDPNTKKKTKGRFLAETVTGLPSDRGARLQFQPITPAIKGRPPAAQSERSSP